MKQIMKVAIVVAIIVILLLGGCGGNPPPEQGSSPGQAAPDFRLQTLDNNTISLSGLRGKPVLVNFWATWCGPCRSEMPLLQEIYETVIWQEKGLTMLAINLRESAEVAQKYMEKNGFSFTVLLDKTGEVGTIYNIKYIPTTYFIDKDGIIKDIKIGAFVKKAEIEHKLSSIME